MEATTEFHKKVSIEQSLFCLEQDSYVSRSMVFLLGFAELKGLEIIVK